MRRFALLLPLLVLSAGCAGPVRKPPERQEPLTIRVALFDDPELDSRLKKSFAGITCIVQVPQGDDSADVAVVYGDPEPPAGMFAMRIPAWDRVWYLEVDPLARWVNDPNFRRWLAARIDRAGMASVLFGNGAEPVSSGIPEAGRRPVSSGALPRLQIVREAGNPTADRIVSRLRADLLPDRVLVEPSVLSPDRAIALHLRDDDPAHTGAEPDTVIPLIRERAYLWIREGLTGIVIDPDGDLVFEHARWSP